MNVFQRLWKWLTSLFFKKELSLTIIGLPNAGKTTLVRAISGENTQIQTVPTLGCRQSTASAGSVDFSITDIGGHQDYQFLWAPYCEKASVILFVIDASDYDSVDGSHVRLNSLLEEQTLSRIPILVIGNKQDISGALSYDDILARLGLQDIDDHPIHLFTCSARTKAGVDDIVKWIVDNM